MKDIHGIQRGQCNICECTEYKTPPSSDSPNKLRCEYCNHTPVEHVRIEKLGKCNKCGDCQEYLSEEKNSYTDCGYCGCEASEHAGAEKFRRRAAPTTDVACRPLGMMTSGLPLLNAICKNPGCPYPRQIKVYDFCSTTCSQKFVALGQDQQQAQSHVLSGSGVGTAGTGISIVKDEITSKDLKVVATQEEASGSKDEPTNEANKLKKESTKNPPFPKHMEASPPQVGSKNQFGYPGMGQSVRQPRTKQKGRLQPQNQFKQPRAPRMRQKCGVQKQDITQSPVYFRSEVGEMRFSRTAGTKKPGIIISEELFTNGLKNGYLVVGVKCDRLAFNKLERGELRLFDVIIKMNDRDASIHGMPKVFKKRLKDERQVHLIMNRDIALPCPKKLLDRVKHCKPTHIFALRNVGSSQLDFGLTVDGTGVLKTTVSGVSKDTPARECGLKFGDEIVNYAFVTKDSTDMPNTCLMNSDIERAARQKQSIILAVKRK